MTDISVEVNIDDEQLPGLQFDDDLVVNFVAQYGPCDGKICVGDRIISVNGVVPGTGWSSLEHMLRKSSVSKITVNRDDKRSERIIKEISSPAMKEDDNRLGFVRRLVKLRADKEGTRIGLDEDSFPDHYCGDSNFKQQFAAVSLQMVDHTSPKGTVFVTNVIRGSIAERVLLFADRILAIDDQKVTDKFTTKQAITETDGTFVLWRTKGLRSPKAEVTLLIERPVTCEALFAAANDFLVKH